METLELPPFPEDNKKTKRNGTFEPVSAHTVSEPSGKLPEEEMEPAKEEKFPIPETAENLTGKEIAIRAACVILLPMLSGIDWTYHTHTVAIIVPVAFYLEVTAFTSYCPIKAIFSKYRKPDNYE